MALTGTVNKHCLSCCISGWCACVVSFAALYSLFWYLTPSPPTSQARLGRRDITTTPFTDFIDPNLRYLPRMFYSGSLIRQEWEDLSYDRKRVADGKDRPDFKATVFHGQENQIYNMCVPFYAPKNRTLRICVYDREVDQMISAYLLDYGVWEKEQVEDMAELLLRDDADIERRASAKAMLKPNLQKNVEVFGGTMLHSGRDWERLSVVDVGCNVGVYTLAAASLGHKVLALDPVQSNLQLLDSSLRLSQLSLHVTLLLNALSDLPGPVQVHVNPSNIGGSFVSQKQFRSERTSRGRPTVNALCLNHIVPLVPTRRVLLKLDIEGWEGRVLRCAADFFQMVDVRYVLMEWLFLRQRREGGDVINFLLRNGLLPYADVTQSSVLDPEQYYAWPDNVWWMKR